VDLFNWLLRNGNITSQSQKNFLDIYHKIFLIERHSSRISTEEEQEEEEG